MAITCVLTFHNDSLFLYVSGYDDLFSHLNKIQGSYKTKRAFVTDIIHEASRFKKKVLVSLLEQFEKSLIQHSKQNAHNNNKHR